MVLLNEKYAPQLFPPDSVGKAIVCLLWLFAPPFSGYLSFLCRNRGHKYLALGFYSIFLSSYGRLSPEPEERRCSEAWSFGQDLHWWHFICFFGMSFAVACPLSSHILQGQ